MPRKQSVPFFEQDSLSGNVVSIYTENESHWKKNLNRKARHKKHSQRANTK